MPRSVRRTASSDTRPHAPGQTSAVADDLDGLSELISCVRQSVRRRLSPAQTAWRVAEDVAELLPSPDFLTPSQRLGNPEHYEQHVLHVEPDGGFSIVGLVWRLGQETPVHDHVCWCVIAVLQGAEDETMYELRDDDHRSLVATGHTRNTIGSVCAFAPPGDIHRVRNAGCETAISLHVYGADIAKLGSSIRRCYSSSTGYQSP